MDHDAALHPITPPSPPDSAGTSPDLALPAAGPQYQVAPNRDAAERLIDSLKSAGHTIVHVEARRFGEFTVIWR
jgi:hypothetical protein